MCRIAEEDGVRTIVATPTWDTSSEEPPLGFGEYEERLGRLRETIGGRISVKMGFMLRFSENIPRLLERFGDRITLNGARHLLVSLPPLSIPDCVEDVLGAVARMGYAAVITRPECSPVLRGNPGRIRRWVESGHCLQLDASSITGGYGREVQKSAFACAQGNGNAVVLASGARNRATRMTLISAASQRLSRKVGQQGANLSTRGLPEWIIDGRPSGMTSRAAAAGRSGFLDKTFRSAKAFITAL